MDCFSQFHERKTICYVVAKIKPQEISPPKNWTVCGWLSL